MSIVILAWRLTDQLLSCLRSVRASLSAPAFEIQLVLNGASAAVRELVSQSVRGVHITDLAANIGFGGGCNAGAAAARGEHLIFLNDDTIVSPTWLSSLVSSALESGGAVASVLLNEDGTIQEAGSRVLAGAGTVQFGKDMAETAATAAGYLGDREIDYGSGAALLVRRDHFDRVGGFDPLFEPAYFEDVDLCFRLRQVGISTRLARDARLVHLSGESTRNDHRFREFASGRSGANFIARWTRTLDHAPAIDAPLDEICDPAHWSPVVAVTVPRQQSAESTALTLVSDYSQWLAMRLDTVERTLDESQKALDGAHHAIDDAHAQLRAITARLEDLDSRGPLGIVKWKAGLALQRRRREQR